MTATPIALRSALSQVARTPFQVRKRFSLFLPKEGKDQDSIYGILLYHGERQFLWAFLRKEALAGEEAERVELRDIAGKSSLKLAKAYRYLGLNAEIISNGLVNSHQADRDTALQFNISPTDVRPLLSKALSF